MDRRSFLATLAASAAAASVDAQPAARARKGRIKQALMRFAFGPAPTLTFDDMCREAARLGYVGFDLTGPPDWPTLEKHGLICTMAPAMGVTIRDGLIRPELHQAIERSMHEEIDLCAARKFPNIITVGGERRGIGYEEGKEHCAALLNRVKSHACLTASYGSGGVSSMGSSIHTMCSSIHTVVQRSGRSLISSE